MNTATDILNYAQIHNIGMVAEDGQLKIDAPETALTDDFLCSAKQHKEEIIKALREINPDERWSPELADEGYVWCYDCKFWDSKSCSHPDNSFRQQCPQAPRKCYWYEELV